MILRKGEVHHQKSLFTAMIRIDPSRRNGIALISLCFCLALFLRLWGVNTFDVWFDEWATIRYSFNSIARVAQTINVTPAQVIFKRLRTEPHSFSYYLFIYYTSFFVRDEKALRLFSVACSMATVFIFYTILSRRTNFKERLWGFLLLAISPAQIWYAQEIRGYAFSTMWAVLLLWAILETMRVPDIPHFLWSCAIGFVSIAAYPPSITFLAVLAAALLIKKGIKKDLKTIFISIFLLFILGVVLAWYFFYDWHGIKTTFSWIPVPPMDSLYWIVAVFNAGYSATVWQHALGVCIFGILCVRGIRQYVREDREPAIFLLSLFLTPIIGLLIISTLCAAMFVIRYVLFVSPIYYLFVGKGIASIKNRYVAYGLITGVVLLSASSLTNYYRGFITARADGKDFYPGIHEKTRYMDTMRFVEQSYLEGDILITTDISASLMVYSLFKESTFGDRILSSSKDYLMGIAFYPKALAPYEKAPWRFSDEPHNLFVERSSSQEPYFFIPTVLKNISQQSAPPQRAYGTIRRVWLISTLWNSRGAESLNTTMIRQFIEKRCDPLFEREEQLVRTECFSCVEGPLNLIASPRCIDR